MQQWSKVLLLVALAACGSKGDDGGAKAGDKEPAANPGSGKRVDSAVFEGKQVHHDLVRTAFLADARRDGVLAVDFGTAARHKYTVGNWRSGFLEDATTGKETFSLVGDSARVFFQVDAPGALTARFRIRPVGGKNVTPYMNGEALPTLRMADGADFQEHEFAVPAERVVAGENQLMFRFGGTQKVGDKDVGAALDWLRISPAGATGAAPAIPAAQAATADGEARQALLLEPGVTLSFYVQVPAGAELGLGVAAAKAGGSAVSVRVSAEGMAPKSLLEVAADEEWHDEAKPFGTLPDAIARVDVSVPKSAKAGAQVGPLAVMVPKTTPKTVAPAKNVVVLLIDTLRAERLKPFNGKSRVKTPVLDGLADAGTVFANAQAPENWTKPSTASVLTGLFPVTHGAKTDAARVPEGAVLLPEALKKAGFRTGSFIANGYVSDKFGFNQGWDHYTNFIRENKSTEAENVFKEAADWVEKQKGERFFAYVHTIDPHVPYDPPDEYLKLYDASDYAGQVKPRLTPDLLEKAKRSPPAVTFDESDKRRLLALHDGEISYHDHFLGVFIDRLKKLGVWNDTVLLITSDHGEEFNEHGSWGHGHSVYQELLHVPLLVHGPGLAAGHRVEPTVSTVDVTPTVMELVGVAPLAYVEGRSLVGHLTGAPPAGPSVGFSDFLDDRRVIRAGRWKLILRGINATFFDLEADPLETKEVDRAAHPIAFRYLRTMQGQFLGAAAPAYWLEPSSGKAAPRFGSEEAEMDETTKAQLKALGYAN